VDVLKCHILGQYTLLGDREAVDMAMGEHVRQERTSLLDAMVLPETAALVLVGDRIADLADREGGRVIPISWVLSAR
jgi:hypothetical protein